MSTICHVLLQVLCDINIAIMYNVMFYFELNICPEKHFQLISKQLLNFLSSNRVY
jgi:hypothetical protein